MKRERTVLILVISLLLLLAIRGFWSNFKEGSKEAFRDSPERLIETDQPFYPVYFPSQDGEMLIPEFFPGVGTVDKVLNHLVEGPSSTTLVAVLPEDTIVLNYRQQGNIVFVNFSNHLVLNHLGGSRGEILTVYGIVNSLVGISGIEQVQILVDSEPVETLVGHLYIGEPLEKDHSLLSSSEI